MADIEKVIKGLEVCTTRPCYCTDCPYKANCILDSQEVMEDALSLLKERKAVKPVRDKETGRIWLCGNCGTYVGFEDNDPGDPNEFDKFCRECGRPVLWGKSVK